MARECTARHRSRSAEGDSFSPHFHRQWMSSAWEISKLIQGTDSWGTDAQSIRMWSIWRLTDWYSSMSSQVATSWSVACS
jgi:hypothetical protein